MAREIVSLRASLARAIWHMSLTLFFAVAVTVVWPLSQTAAQSGRPGDGHAEMHDKVRG